MTLNITKSRNCNDFMCRERKRIKQKNVNMLLGKCFLEKYINNDKKAWIARLIFKLISRDYKESIVD